MKFKVALVVLCAVTSRAWGAGVVLQADTPERYVQLSTIDRTTELGEAGYTSIIRPVRFYNEIPRNKRQAQYAQEDRMIVWIGIPCLVASVAFGCRWAWKAFIKRTVVDLLLRAHRVH